MEMKRESVFSGSVSIAALNIDARYGAAGHASADVDVHIFETRLLSRPAAELHDG